LKRIFAIAALAMMVVGLSASSASAATTTNIDPTQAPQGTHLQRGTIGCSVSGGVVTCSAYQLGGVGNINATATLDASYTATVRCRNHGGQIVDVKSQETDASTTTDNLRSRNGQLDVPVVRSGDVPSNSEFERNATCPNGNWTKETLESTIALSSFTYTLQFAGFTGNYITITGP
jgi:hypothetical protein